MVGLVSMGFAWRPGVVACTATCGVWDCRNIRELVQSPFALMSLGCMYDPTSSDIKEFVGFKFRNMLPKAQDCSVYWSWSNNVVRPSCSGIWWHSLNSKVDALTATSARKYFHRRIRACVI